jgi:uncharacterized membrane protein YfcA
MIHITQRLSEADYEAASAIHYRTYRYSKYRPWLAGILIFIGAYLLIEVTGELFGILFVVYGIFMLLRKKIVINRITKAAATAKLFGEEIRVVIDESGVISSEVGENSSIMRIGSLFGFVRHPIGFLIYPQRNMFYYLKASAFESEEQMDTLYRMLKNSKIKELPT